MNFVMLSGMVKFAKFTPNSNPQDKWNNARIFFKLVVKKPNAQKLHEEGKPTDDFVNCVARGKTAEYISQYYPDGSKIVITSGRIETYETTNTAGQKNYGWQVLIDSYLPSYELMSDAQVEQAYKNVIERKNRNAQNGANQAMPNPAGTQAMPGQMPAYGQPANIPNQPQSFGQMPAYGSVNGAQQSGAPTTNAMPGQMPAYNQPAPQQNVAQNTTMPGQMPAYSQPTGTGNMSQGTAMSGQMPAYGQTAPQQNMPQNGTMPGQPVAQNAAPQFPDNYAYGTISSNLVINSDDLPF